MSRARKARAVPPAGDAAAREAAISDILGVIASSPGDLQPVFDTILDHTLRLCGGHVASLWQYDGEKLHYAASKNSPAEVVAYMREHPLELGDWNPTPQAALERRPLNVLDVFSNPKYRPLIPAGTSGKRPNAGTVLAVPLVRSEELFGVITIWRYVKRLFSEREVELIKTFTAQAVIAIQNVRLFNETKEALERQTATADILRVIASSPSNVQPVFEAIVQSAVRLCGARFGRVYGYDGSVIEMVASHGLGTAGLGEVQRVFPRPAADDTTAGRAILTRRPVFIKDIARDETVPPLSRQMMEAIGTRSQVTIPMLRAGAPIGVFTMGWDAPAAFNDPQVALLQTFADQAVIAIENARLFNETKEALERQTASAEVLRVISATPADAQPVFEAIAQSALRVFKVSHVGINVVEGAGIKVKATGGRPDPRGEVAIPLDRSSTAGRAVLEGALIQVEDTEAPGAASFTRDSGRVVGFRAIATAPMLREGAVVGSVSMMRDTPGVFTGKQLELLQTFADQAAIAIENARLFNQLQSTNATLREALEQQTATAEVLKVISGSPTDVAPVFEAILKSAVTLCGAELAAVFPYDGERVHLGATHNWPQEALQYFSKVYPLPPSPKLLSGRTILGKSLVKIADAAADEDYDPKSVVTGHWRRMLGAPMLREGEPLGALVVAWRDPGETPPRQVELLQTFADQAAIAIENVRLFREIQDKSAQLEVANQHKSEFLANMSHELRTPLNAVIGFSEALMERMFGELNDKQADYLKDIHESGRHLLSLINDILDLSKIEAGRMELEVSTFHLPSAIANAMTLIRERAQRHAIALGIDVDQALGEFQGDERKFKQIMLNLLSNAVKFTPDGGKVDVSARKYNGQVEVAVRDTGIGIAPEDQALVFEEFRQAGRDRMRKAEGTGLGLALTKRFVELHGGAIRLDSTPGQGSTFSFTLPVR